MDQYRLSTRKGKIQNTFETLKKQYPKGVYNKYCFKSDEGKNKIFFGFYDLLPGIEISILKSIYELEVFYEELKDDKKWIFVKFLKNKTTIDPEKKILTFYEYGVNEVILYNDETTLDSIVKANQYVEIVSLRIRFDVLYNYTTLSDEQLDDLHNSNKKFIIHERMLPNVKEGIDQLFKCQDSEDGVIGYSIAKSLEVLTHFLLQVKYRFKSKDNYGVSDYNYNQMIEIRDYLLEDLSINIEIKEITMKFGVSTANLHRNFKKVFGTSPHKFVKKSRLDNAYELLLETDMPIVEIVDQLGFTHSSHLTNSFKSEFGISPKQVRIKK